MIELGNEKKDSLSDDEQKGLFTFIYTLPEGKRNLLLDRYKYDKPFEQIDKENGKSRQAVHNELKRFINRIGDNPYIELVSEKL